MTGLSVWRWGMWFRIYGHGLSIQINAPILFSERYGYRKPWRFGPLLIERLTP